VGHPAAVSGDAVAVECRLNQAPLTPMKFVLAGQQAVAQEAPGKLEPAAFVKLTAVGYQNVSYVVGMVEQEDVLRSESEMNDIPVGLSERGQKTNRVPPELEHVADQRLA